MKRRFNIGSPLWLLFAIATAIFAVEFAIMLFLPHSMVDAALDAAALVVVLFPLLYVLVFRPMARRITEREQAEAALRRARDQLELRVQERTTELKDANARLQVELAAHRQAEIALRESEAKYRTLVNEVSDGFFIADLSGTLTFANAALARIYGFERPEDLIGRNVMAFVAPAMLQEVGEKFRVAMQTGLSRAAVEVEIVRQDGTSALLEIRPVNILEEGRVVGSRGVIRDVTERRQAEAALRQANERLRASVAALEQRNRETALLAELGDLLQACTSADEASRAIGHTAPQLFPHTSGALFTYSPSRDDLEAIVMWGNLPTKLGQRMFEPDKCWALRRGRPQRTKGLCTGLPCQAMLKSDNLLCVPMAAQGETLGVLHLQADGFEGTPPEPVALNEQLAVTSAEHIALALANLRLRETLRNQSIRDPLTGLFNRRFMEEMLARELRRAERDQRPVGVIMLDLDQFKRFNDTFGHNMGDALLRELGAFLAAHSRGGDVACRFGGEEFVLILPEATLEDSRRRAEEICDGVRGLTVANRCRAPGIITASLGVAVFPDDAPTAEALLHAADMALYRAKAEGRDRIVLTRNSK